MSTVIARRILYIFSASILLVVFSSGLKERAYSSVSSCTATLASASSVDASSTSDFSFNITNGDEANSLVWIKITRPSSNFTVETGGISESYTDTSTSIGPGGFTTTTFSATTGSINVSSANWTVMVSDDPDGLDPTQCTGELGSSIINGTDAITISSVTLSEVTTTSVKISWTTSVAATSVVDYGATSSYGSSKSDGTLSTSHSITLDSLSANTGYHYRISSTDASSNTAQTSDNTFTTAASSTSTTTTTTVVVNTTTSVSAPTDAQKPTVTIATDFSKPYDKAPKITGRATDNKSIVRIEYSLDNGLNWQPVDSAILNKSVVGFSFTPPFLDDDTYKIKVRVTDGTGNTGMSSVALLTIDRLPPNIGSVFFSIGPQPLYPQKDNKIYGLQGMDQKITLSALGGPLKIDIVSDDKMFSLVKNIDNGLWNGILSFDKPGEYKLVAKSIDGGGSKVVRDLGYIVILPHGKVSSYDNSRISSTVLVYYFDITTRQFVLWDGSAYGQVNPQATKSDGSYSLYLPTGKYYIEVKASGHRTLKTEIFEIRDSMPVNTTFKLEKRNTFFDFSQTRSSVDTSKIITIENTNRSLLLGQQLLDIELFDEDKTIQLASLRGKRMLISIVNSWNPQAFTQISILNSVAKKGQINVAAIFPQETSSRINILKLRGAYNFPMLADQDGLLVEPLNILHLPMNFYISRNGTVESVTYGILGEKEIEENLLN